jgi:peptide-methionine (S)-S-oxide reductase
MDLVRRALKPLGTLLLFGLFFIRTNAQTMETITLGGGCFWCIEAVFQDLNGVESATSGYMGGHIKRPAYREVCTGRTGHAEVVQVVFNPEALPLTTLLDVFFTAHDPTTVNRQGADVGTQYRSCIFYETEEQKNTSIDAIERWNASRVWSGPIVTEVAQAEEFYPAEDYHQQYYELNGEAPYCRAVIAPKMKKVHEVFAPLFKGN